MHRGLQGSIVGRVAWDDGQAAHPGGFEAPNLRHRRSFSVMDNRRDENSSPCRMGIDWRGALGTLRIDSEVMSKPATEVVEGALC